jgi:uncharacterized protein YbaA (DUF1428 family)
VFSSIYLYPVPEDRADDFLRIQRAVLEIYLAYGVLDDITFRPVDLTGKYGCAGFERAVDLRPGETVYVSVSHFRDRAHHDEVMARVDDDPRVNGLFDEIQTILDLCRIVRGEFERAP